MLLDFAESGRLEAHRARVLKAGAERLAATLDACRRYLPAGTRWTRPQGGMNVWVRLPEPLDAGELLARAQKEGVAYLPGRYFAVSRLEPGALRLSFAGLHAGADPGRPGDFGKGICGRGGKRRRENSNPRRQWCEQRSHEERRCFSLRASSFD